MPTGQELQYLTNALRQQGQTQQQVTGLEGDLERARAMQQGRAQLNPQTGYVSPLAVIADVIGSSRGRQQERELAPQLAKARQKLAETANAEKVYALKQAMDKQTYERSRNAAQDLIEAEKRKFERGEYSGKGETYVKTDGSDPITAFVTPSGIVDERRKPIDLAGRIPLSEYRQQVAKSGGKPSKAESTQAAQDQSALNSLATVAEILESPDLEAATGALDPRQWTGRLGYTPPLVDDRQQGERIQAIHNKMENVLVNAVKPLLDGLGVNPTDKDLQIAKAPIPEKGIDQPYAWGVWARDQYIPMLEKIKEKGRANGKLTPDLEQQIDELIDRTWIAAAKRIEPEAFVNEQQAAEQAKSQQSSEALTWLQANPDHPKAAAVREKLQREGAL